MRYFLDTEFNGFGGALLSLALVPEDGGSEFYVTLDWPGPFETWVERNVLPYLDTVPEPLVSARVGRERAAKALSAYLNYEFELQTLAHFPDRVAALEIIADWPEDIAQFCMLLLRGPGSMVQVPQLNLRLVELPGFSTAQNSAVPHNALHDARSLRDYFVSLLE